MSDVETGGKKKFEKLTGSPFFTFSKPYLDFIGKEKLFSLVYIILAVANLIIPFVVLYRVIQSKVLGYLDAKYVFAFIFTWLVIVFACWIGFQLWWDRRKKAKDSGSSEFIAILNFSDILQTFGEWLGTLIAIIGAGGGLIAFIFLGNEINYLFQMIGLEFLSFGAGVIILGPVIGFFILIIFRFFAELLRISAAFADNTKEIAANIKNKANS